ncbi:MAG: hypothetical protein ACOC2W_02000 [bacterium]
MDLKKYDELRGKLKKKDFEGKNKKLDRWSYRASFFGNLISIFFAFFLLYPSLQETISLQIIDGFWGEFISACLTTIFLSIFEFIKRYFIRNTSDDYLTNNRKIKPSNFSWFIGTLLIISFSFYLSISGSKNFAETSDNKITYIENDVKSEKDSIKNVYNSKIDDIKSLNDDLNDDIDRQWDVHDDLPDNHYTRKTDIRNEIGDIRNKVDENVNKIESLEDERQTKLDEIDDEVSDLNAKNKDDDFYNAILFIIIVTFNELLIVFGVYFREYFEHTLFQINNKKFEKIYLKRDRYRSLLTFIYGEGKLDVGDKVISGMELKEIVDEKTNIQNSKKFVDEFLRDMDNLGVFVINGKRRHIAVTYNEAMTIIENFDDAYRIIENMK